MHAADLLSRRADLTPERTALVDLPSGVRFTYRQLNERANSLANLLTDQYQVQKGDRVSILAHNSIVYLDLFFGLAKIGAIFAPLNWRLMANELTYIINDSAPRLLFCGPEFADTLAEMRGELAVEHYLAVEGAQIPAAQPYEQLVEQYPAGEPPRPALDAESPYCLLYTSGTTGRPKGAILPHRQILWNCINTVISWGLTENDISPVFTPLFHAGGLFAFLTPLFYAGGRIILGRNFDPEESLRIILEEKCTVILGVPTLFQMWQNSPQFKQADFSHVRFFISGGAPCPVALMDAWRETKNVVFRQGYGLTEVGPNCFSMTDEESVPKSGSVGKPIFHSRMRLVDPETGRDVGNNEPGELAIAGPHVCSGYWNNPDATAKALRDGWFYTGDTASRDADGFYTIIGRYKDMIISGGENIYAAEVEAVIKEHPAVEDAALIGMPHDKWGEVGLMIVILKKKQQTDQEALQEFCGTRLARYKIPKKVVFAEELPYSPYGKVEKPKLREKYLPQVTAAG